MVNLSHTVSRRAASSQVVAGAFLNAGRRRLRGLLAGAPQVRIPAHLQPDLSFLSELAPSLDEISVQHLLEMYLCLILQWLARHKRESGAFKATLSPWLDLSAFFPFSYPFCNPAVRLCFSL